jgi:hypothetical protein
MVEPSSSKLASDGAEASSGSTGWSNFRQGWLARVRNSWVPIILVIVACVSGGIVVSNHSDQLAPFDEWVYYDYVLKMPTQGIVRQGEFLTLEALEAMACDGDAFGPRGEPCDDVEGNYAAYPQGGKTSADIYTPLYFGVTWALGKAVQFVTGAEFLTSARATGIFWLVGGLLVFYKLLELLKVRRIVSLGLGLAIIGAPTTFWANSYISTDAPLFLVGASLLYLGISAVLGRTSPWWLVPVAILGIWLKVTSILALGLVALFIVLFLLWSRDTVDRGRKRTLLVATAVTVAGALAAQVAWLLIRAEISLGAGADQGLTTGLLWRDFAGQLSLFLNRGALGGGYDPILRLPGIVGEPLVLLTIAGVLGFGFGRFVTALERSLAISILIASTVFAPALSFGMYLLLGDVFPVIARYAMPLLPAFFVAVAYIMKNRLAEWSVVIYGALLVLAVTATSVAFA